MNTTPTPTSDPSDLPPDDAEQRMLDALLSTTGESDQARQRRIERVLLALDERQGVSPGSDAVGHIGLLSRLVPAGLAAAILVAVWMVWPSPAVDTAQAAIVRVVASLGSVDHRRYEVTAWTADGARLYGTVDIASGDRFVSRFSPSGTPGDPIAMIAGSDGMRHWLVPPIGPVLISDEPFGPLFPVARDGDGFGAPLLSLPRAITALVESHDIEFAETDDPGLMRFVTSRKEDTAGTSETRDRPALSTADVIAERDSGEVVRATFTLDERFIVGNRAIRSLTFRLVRDAEAPPPEWYDHATHHVDRP